MFKTLETPSEFGLRCNASVSHKRKYFFVQILNVLFYSVNIHLLLKLKPFHLGPVILSKVLCRGGFWGHSFYGYGF